MAHWIEATAEHNRRPVRINAEAIAYLVQEQPDGPTHVRFVGSDYAANPTCSCSKRRSNWSPASNGHAEAAVGTRLTAGGARWTNWS